MVDMKTASGIPDFRRQYLHHSDINNYLDFLQQKYPQMVTVNVIGCTYEGRQLKSIQISSPSSAPQKRSAPRIQSNVRKCANDRQLRPSTSVNVKRKSASNDKPVILIDGGIHGREWATISVALFCANELIENYESNKTLLDSFNFVIVPCVNADGYEYSRTCKRMWRKSRRPLKSSKFVGVDCNRNFSVGWTNANSKQASYTYRGEKPFSEPETKILKYLMHSLHPKFYLSLHSFGKSIMYPYAFTSSLPSNWCNLRNLANAGYAAIIKNTGSKLRIGNVASIIRNSDVSGGGSPDYAYETAKIPFVIVMEVSGNGFQPSTNAIIDIIRESWIGIRAMCSFLKFH